jgi:hypothetical protein
MTGGEMGRTSLRVGLATGLHADHVRVVANDHAGREYLMRLAGALATWRPRGPIAAYEPVGAPQAKVAEADVANATRDRGPQR